MTRPKPFEKPVGLRDYLPNACAKLNMIGKTVLDCMARWGYRQMITPTLEYYDTVGVAGTTEDQKLFKLLDKRGMTLVLRSDMTAPIARVVASVLKEEPLPLRLSYHANVFRAIEEEAGRDWEFFQTGVELVGDASADADAEVVALAVECLKSVGLETFKLAMGHVGFLNGLLEEALEKNPEKQEELKTCLLNRDHAGYRMRLEHLNLSEKLRSELEGVLRLRGGQDICEKARSVTDNETSRKALSHLCEVWDVLKEYGVCEHVLIDLTMIGDFSYYTGLTFEGFAPELGFPIVNGGRYDRLLGQFGRPAPATGFALKTSRIMEIAHRMIPKTPRRVLILYDDAHRKEALHQALSLRKRDDWTVETRRLDAFDPKEMIPLEEGGFLFQGRRFDGKFEFFGAQSGGSPWKER